MTSYTRVPTAWVYLQRHMHAGGLKQSAWEGSTHTVDGGCLIHGLRLLVLRVQIMRSNSAFSLLYIAFPTNLKRDKRKQRVDTS